MGRRKKSRFLSFRINGKTFFSMIGFFLVLVGLMMLVSFYALFSKADGRILTELNQQLFELFGGLSFFVPFIIFLLAGHFFNSNKLKFVRLNVTIGAVVLLLSLLGLLQSGKTGVVIFTNLSLDFTALGAISILLVAFILGLVLFLDTSIDVIFLAIIKIFSPILEGFKKMLKGKAPELDKLNAMGKKDDLFIKDTIIKHKPDAPTILPVKPQQGLKSTSDLSIKPVIQDSSTWVYPPTTLLHDVKQSDADRGDVKVNADTIEKTLDSFGIRSRVKEVNYGPTVTQYAIEITRGTKLSKITTLSNDLALALAAPTGQVRIEEPIPGRSLVGIEIPNIKPQLVTLKQLIETSALSEPDDPLLVPLGLEIGDFDTHK